MACGTRSASSQATMLPLASRRTRRRTWAPVTSSRMRPPVLAAVAGRRHDDQPLAQRLDRRVVVVAEALLQDVPDARGRAQVQSGGDRAASALEHRRIEHHPVASSSARTVIDSSPGPPKVVAIATSEASRPRPITTRPLRRAVVARDRRSTSGPPADFHPGGEVHRGGIDRGIHVGQVAEDVAGRDVQRAAERDRQVGEVAADAEPAALTSAASSAGRSCRTGRSGRSGRSRRSPGPGA